MEIEVRPSNIFTLASALVQSEKSEASMIKIGGLVQAVATSLG